MKKYLSYGAGVGSEALRLWLLDQGWEFEAVYVNHFCDWPDTQRFAKTIPNLTVIKVPGMLKEMWKYKIVPSMQNRWCTVNYKVKPYNDYVNKPCISYLGYTANEPQRAKQNQEADIYDHFPLIAMGWTRQDCKDYIQQKTGNVPIRSGCWFCPSQRPSQWIKLKNEHPNLYRIAKQLEKRNMEYRKERGKPPLYLSASKKPLEMITHENQKSFKFS